jgi:hypothetical protein
VELKERHPSPAVANRRTKSGENQNLAREKNEIGSTNQRRRLLRSKASGEKLTAPTR